MKYFSCIILTLLFCNLNAFSQEKNIKHFIAKGETISSIAQKYKVSPATIYKLNPKAKKTLQLNQLLLIPNLSIQKTKDLAVDMEKTAELNHEVQPKETLYGITKQYKTTVELLYKANPELETNGLKIGQNIIIPTTNSTQKEIASVSQINTTPIARTTPLMHTVKPKESLYAIAKEYGITYKELKAANPKLGKKGLSIGQIIVIPNNEKLKINSSVVETKEIDDQENKDALPVIEKNVTEESETNTKNQGTEIIHEVLPKETKYGIAKQYGITVATLEKQNPSAQQKLLVGSKLSIRIPNSTTEKTNSNEVVETQKKNTDTCISFTNDTIINQLIASASEKIGTRYRSGGTTVEGFDCSGLMYSTFGSFDIKLPRSSIEQAEIGEKIGTENAQKGDLIFFKTRGRSRINHVGMVVDVANDEIKFIHSSTHGGVIISSTKEPYYEKHFAQVNRIIK